MSDFLVLAFLICNTTPLPRAPTLGQQDALNRWRHFMAIDLAVQAFDSRFFAEAHVSSGSNFGWNSTPERPDARNVTGMCRGPGKRSNVKPRAGELGSQTYSGDSQEKGGREGPNVDESTLTHDRQDGTGYSVIPHTMA